MKNAIDAAALTTFEVALDGSSVRLNVLDQAGAPASMTLPSTCFSQLLMTIPRMIETAVRNAHQDDSLRFVQPIEKFALEIAGPQSTGIPHLILTLETGGGFKVSFSASEADMQELGRSIVETTEPHMLAQWPRVLRS